MLWLIHIGDEFVEQKILRIFVLFKGGVLCIK